MHSTVTARVFLLLTLVAALGPASCFSPEPVRDGSADTGSSTGGPASTADAVPTTGGSSGLASDADEGEDEGESTTAADTTGTPPPTTDETTAHTQDGSSGPAETSTSEDAGTSSSDDGTDGSGCSDARECPPPASPCEQAACSDARCVLEPVRLGLACDDGSFCTLVDACDGQGACVGVGDPCPAPDGDGDCSESCDETTDACTADDAAGTTCDDGLFCTQTDRCNGAGSCLGADDPCPGPDGDADCTESCDEASNACDGDDPAGSDCGGVCNVCDVNGSCDVFEPGQCP